MSAPTNVWDVTQPPDTQAANQLGLDLRNVRVDVQQRMAFQSDVLGNRWNPDADAQPANWTGLLFFATDTGQLFRWNGAAWVQIPFNGNIVAVANLTGQLVAIPLTVLYAVPVGQSGVYQASCKIFNTVVGTGGNMEVDLAWNNGAGNIGPLFVTSITTLSLTNEPLVASFNMYANGGTNIQYRVVFNGVTGAPQYSLQLRLEYLG